MVVAAEQARKGLAGCSQKISSVLPLGPVNRRAGNSATPHDTVVASDWRVKREERRFHSTSKFGLACCECRRLRHRAISTALARHLLSRDRVGLASSGFEAQGVLRAVARGTKTD